MDSVAQAGSNLGYDLLPCRRRIDTIHCEITKDLLEGAPGCIRDMGRNMEENPLRSPRQKVGKWISPNAMGKGGLKAVATPNPSQLKEEGLKTLNCAAVEEIDDLHKWRNTDRAFMEADIHQAGYIRAGRHEHGVEPRMQSDDSMTLANAGNSGPCCCEFRTEMKAEKDTQTQIRRDLRFVRTCHLHFGICADSC